MWVNILPKVILPKDRTGDQVVPPVRKPVCYRYMEADALTTRPAAAAHRLKLMTFALPVTVAYTVEGCALIRHLIRKLHTSLPWNSVLPRVTNSRNDWLWRQRHKLGSYSVTVHCICSDENSDAPLAWLTGLLLWLARQDGICKHYLIN